MSDPILPIPRIPDGLRQAAQRGRLVIFVGAGISKLAGCPDWSEFADAEARIESCVNSLVANEYRLGVPVIDISPYLEVPAANQFVYCSPQICQEVLVNGVRPPVSNVMSVFSQLP